MSGLRVQLDLGGPPQRPRRGHVESTVSGIVIMIIILLMFFFILIAAIISEVTSTPSETGTSQVTSQTGSHTSSPPPTYVPEDAAVVKDIPRIHTNTIDPTGARGLTELRQGESIMSANKQYRATIQPDGNFVVYNADGSAKWHTRTHGTANGPFAVKFRSDGQLVIVDSGDNTIWSSGKPGTAVALVMQDDGNLVVYQDLGTPDQKPIWHCC